MTLELFLCQKQLGLSSPVALSYVVELLFERWCLSHSETNIMNKELELRSPKQTFVSTWFEALYCIAIVKQLSTEYRKTSTKVITLTNHRLNHADNPMNQSNLIMTASESRLVLRLTKWQRGQWLTESRVVMQTQTNCTGLLRKRSENQCKISQTVHVKYFVIILPYDEQPGMSWRSYSLASPAKVLGL